MAWEPFIDYTVPSTTTSVIFDNLDISKEDFVSFFWSAIPSVNGTMHMRVRVNDDNVDSSYTTNVLRSDGTNTTSNRFNGNSEWYFQGGSINKGVISGYLKIPNSNFPVFHASGYSSELDTNISTTEFFQTCRNTHTSINKIQILGLASNRVAAGTRFQFYKMVAEKVADVTITSNVTRVDFTGLNITSNSEYLLVSEIRPTSSGTAYRLFVNNNTNNSNYYAQRKFVGSPNELFAQRIQEPRIAFSDNRTFVYTYIKVTPTGVYTSFSFGAPRIGETNMVIDHYFVNSTGTSVSSINQLNLLSTGNIATGSKFELYKLYEGGN